MKLKISYVTILLSSIAITLSSIAIYWRLDKRIGSSMSYKPNYVHQRLVKNMSTLFLSNSHVSKLALNKKEKFRLIDVSSPEIDFSSKGDTVYLKLNQPSEWKDSVATIFIAYDSSYIAFKLKFQDSKFPVIYTVSDDSGNTRPFRSISYLDSIRIGKDRTTVILFPSKITIAKDSLGLGPVAFIPRDNLLLVKSTEEFEGSRFISVEDKSFKYRIGFRYNTSPQVLYYELRPEGRKL